MRTLPPLACLLIVAACSTSAAQRPNILLILTDDQGWGDVHSHGNDVLATPHLDRLAKEGARLERFYVCKLCAPTRASLLTGRYHLRTGVHGVTRAAETMRVSEVTIAELLKGAGYRTGCFGKWHNGANWPHHPSGQGFDEFLGFCGGHWNLYFDPVLQRTRPDSTGPEPTPRTGYISDTLTDAALEFTARPGPWFCYLAYNAPHSPFQVPDAEFARHKARGLSDELASIYGMCENLDANIGRLLGALREAGTLDSTVVIFLTDNGPNSDRFNGHMKGRKGSPHEGGVRTACFMRYPPRIAAGTVVEEIAAHIDMLPTLAELCDLPARAAASRLIDGRSLMPLMTKQQTAWRDERMIFTDLGTAAGQGGAVRTSRWRAVKPGAGPWELYDMRADPDQKQNLAAEQPAELSRLQAAWLAHHKEVTSSGFDLLPTQLGGNWTLVTLPGHEALLQPDPAGTRPGISYFGKSGWANDWVANWTSTAAFPRWEIDVLAPGRYEVTLHYALPEADVGACLSISAAGQIIETTLTKAEDAPLVPMPDRIGRKEAPERRWGRHLCGTFTLPAGKTTLDIRALSKPGSQVGEIKAVELRRLSD
ncbi:MAG: arylsulfatase [Pirellulaceae bacterium]|nr:arylsulfatase [Pirellulaceae bacterium]